MKCKKCGKVGLKSGASMNLHKLRAHGKLRGNPNGHGQKAVASNGILEKIETRIDALEGDANRLCSALAVIREIEG